MMKRVFFTVLLLMMAVFLNTSAEKVVSEPQTCLDFQYIILEDGCAEIVGYTGTAQGIIIPESLDGTPVRSIGTEAFFMNDKLTSAVIPEGVTMIGAGAFKYCTGLENISLPESLVTLGDSVFYKCKSLKTVTLPGGIKTVPWETFAYSGIESLVLSDGIVSMDELAVDYCDNLTSVVLPSTLEFMDEGAIYACDGIKTIELPSSLRMVGGNPFSCCMNLSEVILAQDNPYFEMVDGILYGIEDQSVVCCPAVWPGTEIIIRDGTKIIHKSAFCWSLNIEAVRIPESVTSIGNYAFQGCQKLKSVNVPDSVNRIGNMVFYKCPNLTLTVREGSYAESYCLKEGIQYEFGQ